MNGNENDEDFKADDLPDYVDLSGGTTPIISGSPPDWFTNADAQIIFVLNTGLILTPAVIAENTDVTRQTVSKRLNTLQAGGYVKKINRGKYKITTDGRFLVSGEKEVYSDRYDSNCDESQD